MEREEVKHTAWVAVPKSSDHGWYVEDDAGRTVCDLYFMAGVSGPYVRMQEHLPEQAEQHARLISAAPDLLEAAKAARDGMEASGGWDGDEDVFSLLIQAIAKASGQ